MGVYSLLLMCLIDAGIDRSAYEPDVQFEDPITRYDNIDGRTNES